MTVCEEGFAEHVPAKGLSNQEGPADTTKPPDI